MRLKREADVWAFLRDVVRCSGEIMFCTDSGDQLNLKSELTRYVFVSQMGNEDFLYSSRVCPDNEADRALLGAYLTA